MSGFTSAAYADSVRQIRGRRLKTIIRWGVGSVIAAALIGSGVWLVWSDAPAYQFLVRLYLDKRFLRLTLREWGLLAPVIFIGMQALQVIIAPIPGDLTGILGGYLFGEWVGLVYSSVGLTVGSVAAFAVGRWLGAHYVQRLVSPDIWRKLGFIVEAEGTILCFVIFLIPGLPKDMTCYLFGLSVRARLDARPCAWHLDPLRAGCPHGVRRLCRGDSAYGPGGGRRPAAVLPPQSPGRMVSRKTPPRGRGALIRPAWIVFALALMMPLPLAAQDVPRECLWSSAGPRCVGSRPERD